MEETFSILYITENAEKYKTMLKNRFMNDDVVDKIVQIHKDYTDILIVREQTARLKNTISKLINKSNGDHSIDFDFSEIKQSGFTENIVTKLLKDNLGNYTKKSLISLAKESKQYLELLETKEKILLKSRNSFVNKLPNLLHESVPIFESEQDNKIIKLYNSPSNSEFNKNGSEKLLNQYELCCKLNIIEDASMIAGNRGYFLVNEGVRLNYALINYALDFLEQKSYKLMYTPHFMKKEKIQQVCQLSEFEETLYKLEDSDLFLIATSEQPITTYFESKKLDNLPVKICGVSSCYRKEAGKHGADTLGIFRVHQFEKIEQFCVTTPDKSWEMMEDMCDVAQEFLSSLGLSYQVVNIVSKELNNAAAMKYDIEGFFPGSGKFRELVSCSNTTDFFSRKIKTTCSTSSGNVFAHLLNSTLCANTRTLCCILETHQVEDGVVIPEVLRKYYNKDKIMFKN